MLSRLLRGHSLLVIIFLVVLLSGFFESAKGGQLPPPDAQHGEQLYMTYCSACHNDTGMVGPPLVNSAAYFVNAGYAADSLGTWLIPEVRKQRENSSMPVFTPETISDADLMDMGYYLGQQTPAPETAMQLGSEENGATMYGSSCAICHGTATDFANATMPMVIFMSDLRQTGAPATALIGYVNMSCRSGYISGMPQYTSEFLSDQDLLDIAAHIWAMPEPPPQ